MRLRFSSLVTLLAAPALAACSPTQGTSELLDANNGTDGRPQLSDFTAAQIESGAAWKAVRAYADARMKARKTTGKCTYETARVRKEFRNMSKEQRKAFTDAVTCLTTAKPENPESGGPAYPGVRSRWDEYVATHINGTYNIHRTADFLAWHRHFIFVVEQDLARLCNYTGTFPYWDWSIDAEAVDKSELFNGDEYSLGSNGRFIPGRNASYDPTFNITVPPGTGGGCVLTGPFSREKGYETHLGPIYSLNRSVAFNYRPRCLIRDLNSFFAQRWNTYANVTNLVLGAQGIARFQDLMQGPEGDTTMTRIGVHAGGHFIGGAGSQMSEFFANVGDPIFFTHHEYLDLIWLTWVHLDPDNRLFAIAGGSTYRNNPPSPDMKLSDVISFGFTDKPQVFRDLMDTLAGPYCYRYE